MPAEVQITVRTASGSSVQLSGSVDEVVATTITETLAKIILDNATQELATQPAAPSSTV